MDNLQWLKHQYQQHPSISLPRHIAIIMDGNGRWARRCLHPRSRGHAEGAKALKKTVLGAHTLSIPYLTLYAFSLENWGRPAQEIDAVMDLLVHYLDQEREELLHRNIRLHIIGQVDMLPKKVQHQLRHTCAYLKECTGITITLALSYSSRDEITQAVREVAEKVATGELAPEDIHPSHIEESLATSGMPDPDLLIRTSGEMRLSNFLLWQLAYTEFYFPPVYWPEFNLLHFWEAILSYSKRQRRFGLLRAESPHFASTSPLQQAKKSCSLR